MPRTQEANNLEKQGVDWDGDWLYGGRGGDTGERGSFWEP